MEPQWKLGDTLKSEKSGIYCHESSLLRAAEKAAVLQPTALPAEPSFLRPPRPAPGPRSRGASEGGRSGSEQRAEGVGVRGPGRGVTEPALTCQPARVIRAAHGAMPTSSGG